MTDAVQRGGLEPDHFSRYVLRTFRQTLRGYSTAEVDAHLRQVRGWFTLAGFDQLVADHREEILGSALHEAEATVEQARRHAAATTEQAQRESEAMLERARRASEAIQEDAGRRAQAATAAVEERLAALKTLALAILEEIDAQS
jgi:DivIVA domain-containing protein